MTSLLTIIPNIIGWTILILALMALVGWIRMIARPVDSGTSDSAEPAYIRNSTFSVKMKFLLIREVLFLLIWPILPFAIFEASAGKGYASGLWEIPFGILLIIATPVMFIYMLYHSFRIPPDQRHPKIIFYGLLLLNFSVIFLYLKLLTSFAHPAT